MYLELWWFLTVPIFFAIGWVVSRWDRKKNRLRKQSNFKDLERLYFTIFANLLELVLKSCDPMNDLIIKQLLHSGWSQVKATIIIVFVFIFIWLLLFAIQKICAFYLHLLLLIVELIENWCSPVYYQKVQIVRCSQCLKEYYFFILKSSHFSDKGVFLYIEH